MKKLLKKNGMYLQSKLENGRLNLVHTENIDDATLFPEEDVVVLQKYFNCTVVYVSPKWGIFCNGDMEDVYIVKQQLICYPLSNLSGDTDDVVIGFHPVHDLNPSLKIVTFDNYGDAVSCAATTAVLLPHVDDVYVEKI